MSETELLRAFTKEQSEDAFAELLRRYAGLVYSVAKRRVNNAALAEDITQIVFIRLAKAPPKVNTHAELSAWLHRTTVNVTIDTWRSEVRRRAREEHAAMETTEAGNLDWSAVAPEVDAALNELSSDDRQTLLLRFFGQKSMREVGVELGVSEDAAKMRVSRALERLRTALGAGGAACTIAVLGTLLSERAVEAAPASLLTRLSALKLAGISAGPASVSLWSKFSTLHWVAGGLVVALIVGTGVYWPSLSQNETGRAMVATEMRPAASVVSSNDSNFDNKKKALPGNVKATLSSRTKPVFMMFRVVDAETGIGLPDVRVQAAFFGVGGEGEGHDVYTDAEGVAAIPRPDDATRSGPNVFVVKDGYVPKVVSFFRGKIQAEYTMKLESAMMAGGRVINEDGQPLTGVKITIQNPGSSDKVENVDFQTCPITNRMDGTWSCCYLPKSLTQDMQLILNKPGFATTLVSIPSTLSVMTNLCLVMNRGFVVTGRIMDTNGIPIADAGIRVITGEPGKKQNTKSDQNGFYTFAGVAGSARESRFPKPTTNERGDVVLRGLVSMGQAEVDLAVQAESFMPQSITVKLINPTNNVDFTLTPGRVLRGRVVNEQGRPIWNAVVKTDWDNQGLRVFEWSVRTDAEGRFEWDSAPERPILYWIEADGYEWQRDVKYLADGSEHEIVLKTKVASEAKK